MIWLHFETGHSGCFQRRGTVGMQGCEVPDRPHSSDSFPRGQCASLGYNDGGGSVRDSQIRGIFRR